jgi:4-amino-4-deoxy-L-arabinose transferase-like glycosyltransferase
MAGGKKKKAAAKPAAVKGRTVTGPARSPRAPRLPAWWPLPALMAVGLLLRLSLTLWSPLYYPDSCEYLDLAREIKAGALWAKDFDLDGGFNQSRRRPPLYPALVAAASVAGGLERAAIVVSLALSLLAFIPLYLAAERLFSRRAAIIVAALYAGHPFLLWYASPALTEAAFIALYAAVIAAGSLALATPRPLWFGLAGGLSALLLMAKETGIVALPVIVAGAAVKLAWLDRAAVKKVGAWLGIMLAAFFLVGAPYFIHIRVRSGHWGVSAQMSGRGMMRLLFAGPGDLDAQDQYPLRGLDREAPGQAAPGLGPFLAKAGSNLAAYGWGFARQMGPAPMLLALAGIVVPLAGSRRGRDRARLFWGLWPLWWAAPPWILYSLISPFMVDERYMYPVAAPALLLCAAGVLGLVDAAGRRGLAPRWTSGLAAALTLVAVVSQAGEYRTYWGTISPAGRFTLFGASAKDAAEEMIGRGLVPPGKVICARKPFLPYYLHGKWYTDRVKYYTLPPTRAELADLVQRGAIDYLAVDTYTLRTLRPELTYLALGYDPLPGTRIVYSRYFDDSQRIITVYDCRHPEPPLPARANAKDHVGEARRLLSAGYLVGAGRELDAAVKLEPGHREAWELRLQVFDLFYSCTRSNQDIPTLAMAPQLLPDFLNAAEQYRRLAPDDQRVSGLLSMLTADYRRERALMEQGPPP